jgi:hypothetical protein
MNPALLYLFLALLKRKTLQFCHGLRRPATLIGFAAVWSLIGFLFYYRDHEIFGHLVRRESLIGAALVMLGGSLFKGFLQRGLVFEPPDLEFLFTSPFTQRQIIFYRLLPNYLFAFLQGLVFLSLFAPHLAHPVVMTVCFILFQIVCFHVATGAAIFAGTISEIAHHRARWMMLGAYFILSAVYLRTAWEIKIIPSFVSTPLAQLLFFPAVTLSDVGAAPILREWALRLVDAHSFSTDGFGPLVLYLASFVVAAGMSLWLLLKLKGNVFEISLATTNRAAEKRLRVQQGRRAAIVEEIRMRSMRLPKLALFRGMGAIVWKNLVVARRSKRELVLALVFTLIFTGPLAALLWLLHDLMSKDGEASARDITGFNLGIASFLVFLGFLLQRTFPFDFRADGQHLVGFRTLPISPVALVLAEIAVPTLLCLAFQALGIAVLMFYARFEWSMLLLMLLAYPAVAVGLNAVWNLHYLLSATRRASGQAQSASAVGTLMVVAMSFLIFYPSGWTGHQIGRHVVGPMSVPLGFAGGLVVQYLVDLFLVLILARLFQRFEVSRDFQ